MIGTIKAELEKMQILWKMTYMGQHEWIKNRATKRTQNQKWQDFINQATKRLKRNKGLYFKLGKDVCMSSNPEALNNVFCKNSQEKSPIKSIKRKVASK
jgi:hypothetical protein